MVMDSHRELARRLTAGLEQLTPHSSDVTTPEEARAIAELAAAMHDKLAALPAETRHLLHTADSGFAASGQWVDDAIEAQTQQLKKLARATRMVATWLGPDGAAAEQIFVVRGHIRGWAHRWRKADKGTAQVDSDPEFVAFAAECLAQAGIAGDHKDMITKALGADWRTAPATSPARRER
jgi:hypothetical protein